MATASMEAIRRSCTELVESVDRVCRDVELHGERSSHTEFDKATIVAMQRLARVPQIHRLRGRVREASDAEILATMTFMIDFASEEQGVDIVRALIRAAVAANQHDIAARLRKLQGRMVREMQKHQDN